MVLGDLGAQVRPKTTGHAAGNRLRGGNAYYLCVNRNQCGMAVNLKLVGYVGLNAIDA
jgi:uncharacterized protein (DUF885 family)